MALTTAGTARVYNAKHIIKQPLPLAAAGADIARASGSNAAVTLAPNDTKSGVALTNIDYSYRTVATAPATIQASDGTITWGPFNVPLAFGLNRIVFDPPLLFTAGATVTVTLLDGTAVKDLMAWGYIEGTSVLP